MVRLRCAVMLRPPMITSNLPASKAGMIPSQAVGTNSAATPMSAASFLATSISKPTSSPFLSRIAHGTNVDMPTFSAPRFLIVSMTLSGEGCCRARSPQAPAAARMQSTAAIPSFDPLSVNRIILSLCRATSSSHRRDLTSAKSPNAALDIAHEHRQRDGESQVDGSHRHPDLKAQERVGNDVSSRRGEVEHGDHADDR